MKEPTTPNRRENYHHGDLRAQLIEATRQLIEEKGPDHLSVSEACRRAGVSTAAPYKHFKDKDDLLRAVALEGMQRQHRQMIEALVPLPQRSLARVSALGHVYVCFARDEPAVFRLMFGLSEDHAGHDALVQRGEDTFDVVKAEVAAYRGSDVVEDIDIKRAFQLWSFVHGLSFLLIDGKLSQMQLPLDLDAMLDDIGLRVMTDI
ncbi:TetR/AcrR family transcriptional regulator [Gymnodinialimonas sp. 2305UL16-5]|uniref:TetR/AcrR family transcriptional regulator n=1 Tax=Gymnodinialimonas mytili TaxID=3126503 RepID=UPI00309583E9